MPEAFSFRVSSSGKQITHYPILKELPNVVSHTVYHTAVDPQGSGLDHVVNIDAAAPNIDEAHIYLEGPVAIDKFFIKCRNPNITDPEITDPTIYDPKSDVFLVNGEGSIKCNAIESPEITTLFETVGTHAAGFLDLHNEQVAMQAAAETLGGRVSQNETDITSITTAQEALSDMSSGYWTNILNSHIDTTDALDVRITQNEEDITDFSGQMNNASIISQSQENRIEALEDAEAHSNHVQLTQDVAALQTQIPLKVDTSVLTEYVLKTENQTEISGIDSRIGVLENAEAHSNHVQLTQDVAELQTAIPLKADTSVLTEYVLKTANQTEISGIDTRIGVLEDAETHSDHVQITAAVASLNEQVDNIQESLDDNLGPALQDLDGRVDVLENAQAHSDHVEITASVATLNETVSDIQESLDDNLGPALQDLDGRVDVLESAQAHSDHVELTQDVAALQTALPLKADTSILTEYVLKTENQT